MSLSKFVVLTAVLSVAVMHGSEAHDVSKVMIANTTLDSVARATDNSFTHLDKSANAKNAMAMSVHGGNLKPSAGGSIEVSAPVNAATKFSFQGLFRSGDYSSSSSTPSTLADSSMMLLVVVGLAMLQLRRKQRSLPQKPFR